MDIEQRETTEAGPPDGRHRAPDPSLTGLGCVRWALAIAFVAGLLFVVPRAVYMWIHRSEDLIGISLHCAPDGSILAALHRPTAIYRVYACAENEMHTGVDCDILWDVASDTGLHVLTSFVVGDPLAEFRVLTEYDTSTLHTYDRLYVVVEGNGTSGAADARCWP